MAISGKNSIVKVASDPVIFTGGETTTADDKTYELSNVLHETLDYKAEIVVYDDGVETLEDYEVKRLSGKVVFATIDSARGVITVDGSYLPLVVVAKAHEYSLSLNGDTEDITPFQSVTKKLQQTLKSAEISLSAFYDETTVFVPYLMAGSLVVIEVQPSTNEAMKFRFFAQLSSDEISSSVSSIIGESLSFESTDEFLVVL